MATLGSSTHGGQQVSGPNIIAAVNRIVYKKAILEMESTEYVNLAVYCPMDKVIYAKIHNIFGDRDEFAGGEYLAAIILGDDYPQAPPHVEFLTPNGVTQIKTLISINRFGYHNEGYTPESGAYGVAMLLPAVLMQWHSLGPGMGLLVAPTVEGIVAAAKGSVQYNKEHYKDILALFTRPGSHN